MTLIKNIIILATCCIIGFLNYCFLQLGFKFVLPITVLPILVMLSFHYKIPAVIILAVGIFDDAMMNAPVGTFPLVYSLVAYMFSVFINRTTNPMMLIYIFSALYIIFNFIAYAVFFYG